MKKAIFLACLFSASAFAGTLSLIGKVSPGIKSVKLSALYDAPCYRSWDIRNECNGGKVIKGKLKAEAGQITGSISYKPKIPRAFKRDYELSYVSLTITYVHEGKEYQSDVPLIDEIVDSMEEVDAQAREEGKKTVDGIEISCGKQRSELRSEVSGGQRLVYKQSLTRYDGDKPKLGCKLSVHESMLSFQTNLTNVKITVADEPAPKDETLLQVLEFADVTVEAYDNGSGVVGVNSKMVLKTHLPEHSQHALDYRVIKDWSKASGESNGLFDIEAVKKFVGAKISLNPQETSPDGPGFRYHPYSYFKWIKDACPDTPNALIMGTTGGFGSGSINQCAR